MATAHQAGYYAHLILNWKNMWQRRIGRRQRQRQRQQILWSNNQPPPLVMGGNCVLHCLQRKSFGRIIPFVLLLCCVSNDLSKGGNQRLNRFFSGCVLFDVFIYHLPQQLKYIVPNFNFTVKQGWNILDKFYEGPPRCLVYPKLWLTLGDSATGNEVDDEQDIQWRTLYSKLEFYAGNENDVNRYVPT